MFFRTKKSGSRTYLQIVENRWEHRSVKQRVLATLGRLDELQRSGQLAALLISGARFADAVVLHGAQREGTGLVNENERGALRNYCPTAARGADRSTC